MPKRIIPIVVVALVALALLGYWLLRRDHDTSQIVLQGNVDLRQVELPFNDSERISEVLVEEGTTVKAGQVLARLDTGRLAAASSRARRAPPSARSCEKLAEWRATRKKSLGAAPRSRASRKRRMQRSQLQGRRSISDESKGRAISPQDLDARSRRRE